VHTIGKSAIPITPFIQAAQRFFIITVAVNGQALHGQPTITIRLSSARQMLAERHVCCTAQASGHFNGRRRAAAGLPLESVRILSDRLQVSKGVRDGLLDRVEDGIGRRGQAVVHPETVLAGIDQA
jgi:hypothetical protein